MAASTYQVIALAIYFVAMIAIGLWANSKNNSLDDYVLGGRQLSPPSPLSQRAPPICPVGSSWVCPAPSTSVASPRHGSPSV